MRVRACFSRAKHAKATSFVVDLLLCFMRKQKAFCVFGVVTFNKRLHVRTVPTMLRTEGKVQQKRLAIDASPCGNTRSMPTLAEAAAPEVLISVPLTVVQRD